MGDINNMRNVANSNRSMKSYVKEGIKEKQNKPKLKINGIKDLATLLGPNAKNHKLNNNQRTFQLVGRVGIGIAGIAAALSITNAAINSNANSIGANNTQYSSETQTLDKDEVLSYAVNRLTTVVYKNDISSLNNGKPNFKITHTAKTNRDTLIIYENPKFPNGEDDKKFSYTRYNNPDDQYLNRKSNNNPEITELLNLMIDVYNNPNPSQEDLENLENMASKLQLNDFVLDGNSIVAEAERDSGFEIGD